MRGETQALHLAKMMQNYISSDRYELALPLVMVRRSKLKKLQVNDVLLLELKVLKFVLIEGETIYAELLLKHVTGADILEIVNIDKKTIKRSDSNKHEVIKFSFGLCKMKNLAVGNHLDMAQFYENNIMLMLNKKKLAECSLVTIDNEIAVKINKVMV